MFDPAKYGHLILDHVLLVKRSSGVQPSGRHSVKESFRRHLEDFYFMYVTPASLQQLSSTLEYISTTFQ